MPTKFDTPTGKKHWIAKFSPLGKMSPSKRTEFESCQTSCLIYTPTETSFVLPPNSVWLGQKPNCFVRKEECFLFRSLQVLPAPYQHTLASCWWIQGAAWFLSFFLYTTTPGVQLQLGSVPRRQSHRKDITKSPIIPQCRPPSNWSWPSCWLPPPAGPPAWLANPFSRWKRRCGMSWIATNLNHDSPTWVSCRTLFFFPFCF